jgi:NADPH:quinone reductase-like Zn-dependent oxidoreductase
VRFSYDLVTDRISSEQSPSAFVGITYCRHTHGASSCTIAHADGPLDLGPLKSKSAGFVWEFMFTRSMHQTADMIEQHALLSRIAVLIDAGTLRTTAAETMRPINAANLRRAHAMIESGATIGKLVLADWESK